MMPRLPTKALEPKEDGSAGQLGDGIHQPFVLGQHVHLDIVDEIEEFARFDRMAAHQARQRGAVLSEHLLLDALRLDRVDPQETLDIQPHPHVDQPEQVHRRRVERVVQIEDPGIDMIERGKHGRASSGWG